MGLCKHRKPWLPEQLGVGYPGHPHPPGYWSKEGIAGAEPWRCFLLPCVSSLCPQLLMPSWRTLLERSMELEPTGSTGSTGVKAALSLLSSLRSMKGAGSQELHLSPPEQPPLLPLLWPLFHGPGVPRASPAVEFRGSEMNSTGMAQGTGVRNPRGPQGS